MFDPVQVAEIINTALFARSAALYVPPASENLRSYKCKASGCIRMAYSRGYCNAHYLRIRDGIPMGRPILNRKRGTKCATCDRELNGKGGWGLCAKHYKNERRSIIKSELVKAMGGRCFRCQIEYPIAVFDFHHLTEKDASPSNLIDNASLEEICAEIAKCALMCANCHRMKHFG